MRLMAIRASPGVGVSAVLAGALIVARRAVLGGSRAVGLVTVLAGCRGVDLDGGVPLLRLLVAALAGGARFFWSERMATQARRFVLVFAAVSVSGLILVAARAGGGSWALEAFRVDGVAVLADDVFLPDMSLVSEAGSEARPGRWDTARWRGWCRLQQAREHGGQRAQEDHE